MSYRAWSWAMSGFMSGFESQSRSHSDQIFTSLWQLSIYFLQLSAVSTIFPEQTAKRGVWKQFLSSWDFPQAWVMYWKGRAQKQCPYNRWLIWIWFRCDFPCFVVILEGFEFTLIVGFGFWFGVNWFDFTALLQGVLICFRCVVRFVAEVAFDLRSVFTHLLAFLVSTLTCFRWCFLWSDVVAFGFSWL